MDKVGVSRRVIPWMLVSVLAVYLLVRLEGELQRLQTEVANRAHYSFPEKFRFETPYFGLTYVGESGNFIDDRILQYGAFEKPELFLLRKLVGQRKGMVFLDIGANTGTYSLFMAQIVGKVHAVEPFPPVLEKLRHNLEINRLVNVVVHPVGFGKEKGSLPFHTPPQVNLAVGSFSGGFTREFLGRSDAGHAVQNLPLEIGDEYLKEREIDHIDIIKVDIEGYEKLALQGLQRTLLRDRPYVLMELNTNNEEGFHSMRELRGVFPPRYLFYRIVPHLSDLLQGTSTLEELSNLLDQQSNILAVPEESPI